MTPDELRARCAAVTTRIIDMIEDDCLIDYMEQQCQSELESLCREMLAEGLEQATSGLKVSNEKLVWALKELGPTGTNAEAYVKAAVEHVIWARQEAQRVKEGA